MRPFLIRIGGEFGQLRVIGRARIPIGDGKTRAAWKCRCFCGRILVARATDLKACRRISCTACSRIRSTEATKIHGKTGTPEFYVWRGMIARCSDTAKSKSRRNYYDRGIRVCRRWLRSFAAFLADMGPRPPGPLRFTIERMDNDGDYSPTNCCWATYRRQLRNTRRNLHVKVGTHERVLVEWSEVTGLKLDCISNRLKSGWSPAEAVGKESLRSPRRLAELAEIRASKKKRPRRFVVIDGVSKSMRGWSEETGIPVTAIKDRLDSGWDAKKAVHTPIGTTRFGNRNNRHCKK